MSKCDTCSHKEVCKFSEELKAFEAKQETIDKPFGVEIKCQHYKTEPGCGTGSTWGNLQTTLAYANPLTCK